MLFFKMPLKRLRSMTTENQAVLRKSNNKQITDEKDIYISATCIICSM